MTIQLRCRGHARAIDCDFAVRWQPVSHHTVEPDDREQVAMTPRLRRGCDHASRWKELLISTSVVAHGVMVRFDHLATFERTQTSIDLDRRWFELHGHSPRKGLSV